MKGRKEYLLVASDKHICIHYLVSLLTDALHARDRHREGESERKGQIGLTRARIDGKVWICGQASRQWHGTRRFAGMLPLTHLDLIFMGAGRCYRATDGRRRGDHFHLLICPALPLPLSRRRQSMLIAVRSSAALFRHVASLAVASLQLRSHFPSDRNSARHQKQRGGAGRG